MRMDDIVMCARLAGLLAFVLAAGLALTAHAGEGPPRDGTAAIRTADFLNSIGINTTFPNRGQPIEKTIDPARPSAPASEAGAETRNQAEGELSILSPKLGRGVKYPVPGTPGKLAYAIPNQPATVHDMLLQASDGTFQLIVWGERVKGEDTVTVALGGTHASVKVYDPTVGTDPVQSHTGIDSLKLTLSDHPLIIVIPAVAGGTER